MSREDTETRSGVTLWALWVPGLLVAIGAGVATAHGLYEVAVGAAVPQAIAWLYPLITDGLALVAYASTARLADGGRAYAWAVVVLAAGLSGLAQASYLAGGVGAAPAALRFGIGAWPAIAAAIVAHLLFLLGHDAAVSTESDEEPSTDTDEPARTSSIVPAVQTDAAPSVQPPVQGPVQPGPVRPTGKPKPAQRPAIESGESPRERARAAARRHARQHGQLPTVSQLVEMTDVARGTAGNALKELRDQRNQLHIVNETTSAGADQ
ncbi:hypothetical protein HFP15_11740 [Amycolatopsis sp. K13G38]|uniref:DUF2637 domain-containing protein n=1 Tax=Amycolatopsis acididurans TaxID=2724524 RepID=A0ABX1J1A7_9PSEU|nr:hypothetical protein [Amycolatopsis acididurans]NKQ53552.1 hypothetical protein [Amycolatopsis acididurans]